MNRELKYINFDKDRYTIREIIDILHNEFGIDIDGYTANDRYKALHNRLSIVLNTAITEQVKKDRASGVNKVYAEKNGRSTVFSGDIVRQVMKTELHHILYWYVDKETAKRYLQACQNAERRNIEKDYGLYLSADDDDNTTATVVERVRQMKIDIVVQFIFDRFLSNTVNPLPDINSVSNQLAKRNPARLKMEEDVEEAITAALRERKIDIVVDFVCKEFIEIDTTLLEHDVGCLETADDNAPFDEVLCEIIDRKNDLTRYYKIKK